MSTRFDREHRARCIEPGCPFPVGSPVLTVGDGHGNAISPIMENARCMYCRAEPTCALCKNVAQRGRLCRVCASSRAPGQRPYAGDWWPLRDVVVALMRRPELKGVAWTVELRDGEKRIVGRDGAFEIVFRSKLWEPLPTNPEA